MRIGGSPPQLVFVSAVGGALGCAWSAVAPCLAAAGTTGGAFTTGLRMPLADMADPLPWRGTGKPPLGAARIDFLPGTTVHTQHGWEADLRLRVSGYAMAFADESIVPGHRGGVELGVRRFVPPNDIREDSGLWSGGYAGGTLMAEVWGLHAAGPPKVSTLHVVVGYRGLVSDVQPAFLELGVGGWGDRSTQEGGAGAVVRAGVEFFRPIWGAGTGP